MMLLLKKTVLNKQVRKKSLAKTIHLVPTLRVGMHRPTLCVAKLGNDCIENSKLREVHVASDYSWVNADEKVRHSRSLLSGIYVEHGFLLTACRNDDFCISG